MKKRAVAGFLLALWMPTTGGRAAAQEQTRAPLTPLKLELTLTRPGGGEGARAFYTLYLLANSGSYTTLRVGREVAVPVTSLDGAESSETSQQRPEPRPFTRYQYRNVGMNVICRASTSGERYRLELNLERSAIHPEEEPSPLPELPSFRTFNADGALLLRDGESTQMVLGSDPTLGTSWNVEAKLLVLK